MFVSPLEQLTARAASLIRLGDWECATAAYDELFRYSIATRNLGGLVEALRGSSHVRRALGDYEDAEDLIKLRWEIAERNELPAEAARAMHMLGVIHHVRGDLPEAKSLYESALERLRDAGDSWQLGVTCQNLGVIANTQGDLRKARALYLESISAAIRSGHTANAMQAYNNLAMASADLRDWMEAEVYFDRGIEIAEQLGDIPMQAKLHANRAEPLIYTGQLTQAGAALDMADRLTAQGTEVVTFVDIARYRAMIARLQGRLNSAEEHLNRSLRMATENGLTLEHAEVLEELALLRDAQERREEAIQTLREAQDRYRVLGASRDITRTREILDKWLAQPTPVRLVQKKAAV